MIHIYCKNEHLCFVEKPSEWLSVPSRLGAEEPRPVLGIELQKQLGQRVFPVHRLDFEVGGIMVFALSEGGHKFISKLWESKSVTKIYEAITHGVPKMHLASKSGLWTSKLVRGKKRTFEAPHGKDSLTEYELLATKDDKLRKGNSYSYWRLSPLTGRSHQLRYELSHRYQAIVGDKLYGSTLGFEGIALRAVEIIISESDKKLAPEYFNALTNEFKSLTNYSGYFSTL